MSTMSPLQIKLLEMLKWFNQLCEQNEIRYYILGGTMLGAARHKGFIPWDDDIDVGLPRRDYEKLIQLMADNTYMPYILETPYSKQEDYCYPFSKIYDTRTTLIENKRIEVIRGVYIDVFPLDGLGENFEECKKNYAPINKKYNLLLGIVGGVRSGRKWYKNLAIIAARCVPSNILNGKKIMIQLDKMCAERDYETSTWICNDMGAWRLKEAMPRIIMGKPTKYQFEDTFVYGPEDYDSYLTHLYGDWRKLPPKEKQVTHHDFVECNLHQSYMDIE